MVKAGWLSVALLAGLLACRGEARTEDFYGVRLGMTPSDVRDRFDLGPQGTFQLTQGADPRLDWTPAVAPRPVASARFEFHSGMLVAIRAKVDPRSPAGQGPRISYTPTIVSARDPGADAVALTVLSRDCPTHKEEATRLVASGPR